MEKLTIATVRMTYSEAGTVLSAVLIPDIKIDLLQELEPQLFQIKGENQDEFQKNADLVLGAWFAKMTEIELADRERFEVHSNVIECVKYPNGSVKSCALEYVFQERPEFLN